MRILKVTTHAANNELLSLHVVPLFNNYIAENNNSFFCCSTITAKQCVVFISLI